ncbi:uncharacterized protein LOC129890630 [Solanum dulcamara]|uniref:uncharacterized protein LOC129890630 n=1 Tax=Solanum dulcamara TaxID=45834 RepID=UPI002486B540|nr:uncharacterized protein LOC129890630 [Solanum dulcamara]
MASVEVGKVLLNQGLTCLGHCEDESSLNKVGDFLKCMDELRESQTKKVKEGLDMGEVESGKGMNQELGLARASNTLWLQEFNDRFNKVRTDLVIGVACLNPVDTLSSFHIKKILRMAKLYPDDFDEDVMVTLKNQLESYIVDVCDVDKRFSNLVNAKHLNYPLVFYLIKFVLLLPVDTSTIERACSAMKLIKSELQNRMYDDFMSSCMVPYVGKKYLILFQRRVL